MTESVFLVGSPQCFCDPFCGSGLGCCDWSCSWVFNKQKPMDTAWTYDALVCDSQTCTQCNDPVMCVECAICMGLFSKFMRKLKGNENSASTKRKLWDWVGIHRERRRDVFKTEKWAVAMVIEPSPSALGCVQEVTWVYESITCYHFSGSLLTVNACTHMWHEKYKAKIYNSHQ